MGRNNFIAYLQRYQILIFIFFTINFICWKVKYRNCLVCMYVWNTQGNVYVSGRFAANENHTLWFWRWRTFSSTSSRDIQWLVTFQCYHIPGSDRLCSTKRVMCTDTLKISLGYAVRNSQKLLQRNFQKPLKKLRSRLLSVKEITTAHNLVVFK